MHEMTIFGKLHPKTLIDSGLAPSNLVETTEGYFCIHKIGDTLQLLERWVPWDDHAYIYELLTALPFSLESGRGQWQITLGTWTEIVTDPQRLPKTILTMAIAYCGG